MICPELAAKIIAYLIHLRKQQSPLWKNSVQWKRAKGDVSLQHFKREEKKEKKTDYPKYTRLVDTYYPSCNVLTDETKVPTQPRRNGYICAHEYTTCIVQYHAVSVVIEKE